jgi:membrane protease YdiL (CAAX protease family)
MSDLLPYLPEFLGVAAVLWIVTASRRFVYRQIGFVYKQRDGVIALSLWLLAMILEIAIYSGAIPIPGMPGTETFNSPVPVLSVQPVTAVVALLVVLASMLYRRQPPKSAGWNRLTLRTGALAGLSLALLCIFLRGKFTAIFSGVDSVQVSALVLVSVTALAEETVFRGYLQQRLVWWLGKTWGFALTAGLYLVWRLPLILAMPPDTLAVNIALTALQSLLLGWAMLSFGNVTAPLIYHAISAWCSFL